MQTEETIYDLAIIGGGINGTALARLASRHNLKVILLEKSDLARGASSSTSKMIHGGLRYLENGNIPLVSESVSERKVLLETAPHLVYTSSFIFPQTSYNRHPKFLGRLGLWIYKGLAKKHSIGKTPPNYNREELKLEEPLFNPTSHDGALSYLDCQMDDTRLVIENAIQAHEWGAEICTYTEYLGSEFKNETHVINAKDRLKNIDLKFKTKQIAHCAGPWTDSILAARDKPSVLLQSQGSHLFVKGLDVKNNFILPVPESKRFFFVLPWLDGTLVGTTESKAPKHPDLCKTTKEEIDELSQLIGRYFPNSKPKGICTFSGIRPLARSSHGNSVKTSRQHKCLKVSENEYAMIGGKFTTHRLMVEDLFQIMGHDIDFSLNTEKLPGAIEYSNKNELLEKIMKRFGHLRDFDNTVAQRVLKTYGGLALKIDNQKDTFLENEAKYSINHEFSRTPIDFFRRRSNLFFSEHAGLDFFDILETMFEQAPLKTWREHYEDLLKDANHAALKNRP